jgi:hypothetical protein
MKPPAGSFHGGSSLLRPSAACAFGGLREASARQAPLSPGARPLPVFAGARGASRPAAERAGRPAARSAATAGHDRWEFSCPGGAAKAYSRGPVTTANSDCRAFSPWHSPRQIIDLAEMLLCKGIRRRGDNAAETAPVTAARYSLGCVMWIQNRRVLADDSGVPSGANCYTPRSRAFG